MQKQSATAERITVGLIVAAAGLCVCFITLYLCMFDARSFMQ